MSKLNTNIDSWVMSSRHSYDFVNAIDINLWNRKRNEQAIELEGTVDRATGKVLEVYESQDQDIDQVKLLLNLAWKKLGVV